MPPKFSIHPQNPVMAILRIHGGGEILSDQERGCAGIQDTIDQIEAETGLPTVNVAREVLAERFGNTGYSLVFANVLVGDQPELAVPLLGFSACGEQSFELLIDMHGPLAPERTVTNTIHLSHQDDT